MRALAFLMALLFGVSPAFSDPNDYNRTVAFGDSLSDNGNLFKNTFGTNPLSPPYDQRFSNGPTWVEILSNPAKSTDPASSMNRFWGGVLFAPPYNNGAGIYNVNAAIGGAQTVSGFPPSVSTQIGAFLGSGGSFGPNDLVTVQGGANDFFALFGAGTPTLNQLQMASVQIATQEAGNVAGLISAGAKTIIVANLPNIGATPQFNSDPVASGGGALATTLYNATLDQKTQQLAAANPTVNLVQMDWAAVLRVVEANPSAFGLTNVTAKCLNATNTAISAACAAAGPNTYLFWDDVHPTETGHQFLARYATLLLSTEATGAVISTLGQVAVQTRLDGSDLLFRRAAAVDAYQQGGLYAEVIGQSASAAGPTSRVLGGTDIDYGLGGVRGGFDARYNAIQFGAAASYQDGSVKGKYLRSDLNLGQIDAYALTRFGSFFAGVEGGVSFSDYGDINRYTGIPTVYGKGSTSGVDYSIDATLGMQRDFGAITLTPAARVGYASVNIKGYTESADVLALQYGDREINTGFWTVRLRAATPLLGSRTAAIYGEIDYEDLFAEEGNYSAKLYNNTAHAVTINGNDLDGRGLILKAGVAGYLSGNIKISGEYGFSNENGNGDVHSGRLQLTVPFGVEEGLKD